MSELHGLQTRFQDFAELDTVVMAISVDGVEQNREVAESYSPDLLVLSDPTLGAIDAFGVRHENGGLDGDVARPATFIIDRDGAIFWRDLTENWRVRPRPEQLLAEIAGLNDRARDE